MGRKPSSSLKESSSSRGVEIENSFAPAALAAGFQVFLVEEEEREEEEEEEEKEGRCGGGE